MYEFGLSAPDRPLAKSARLVRLLERLLSYDSRMDEGATIVHMTREIQAPYHSNVHNPTKCPMIPIVHRSDLIYISPHLAGGAGKFLPP